MILDSIGLVINKRVFHQALWQNSVYVTLMLTSDANQIVSGSELNQMSGGVSGALKPITEFCDLVPNNYLPSMPTTKVQMVQGKILLLRFIANLFKFFFYYFFGINSNNHSATEIANRHAGNNGLDDEIENTKQQPIRQSKWER
jgi:hypothetical protein